MFFGECGIKLILHPSEVRGEGECFAIKTVCHSDFAGLLVGSSELHQQSQVIPIVPAVGCHQTFGVQVVLNGPFF